MSYRQAGSAREAALQVVYRVIEEGAFASLALNEVLENTTLESRDRALATELAYSTVKAWGTIDWALGLFLSRPLEKLPAWIRCVLRLGASQILYMKRIPVRAIIYETVELAKKYGHKGTANLVNGVLRSLSRQAENLPYPEASTDPAGYLALVHYHPRWLVEEWLRLYGFQDTETLLQMNNQPAPLVLRTNTMKITPAELVELLAAEGAAAEPARYAPEGLVVEGLGSVENSPSFQEGLFYVQDEGSQLVSHALNPPSGAVVMDTSAAPGGKTTHLAQLMGDRGRIIAADIHPGRLELITVNCRRLGITCVETVLADARELGGRYPEAADCILVDAPCTGLGVLRRRADARWRKELAQAGELARLQLEILMGVRGALKPGGILVYSTCSLAPEENDEVVRGFLAAAPEFVLSPIEALYSLLPADLKETAGDGMVQFLPHKHGTDGFYVARLQKTGREGCF